METTFVAASALLCLLCMSTSVIAKKPTAVWNLNYSQNTTKSYQVFPNYLYEGSSISLTMNCWSQDPTLKISIRWILEEIECEESLYIATTELDKFILEAMGQHKHGVNNAASHSTTAQPSKDAHKITFQVSDLEVFPCMQTEIRSIKDSSNEPYQILYFEQSKPSYKVISSETVNRTKEEEFIHTRHRIAKSWADGMFHFLVSAQPVNNNSSFRLHMRLEMINFYGYLPAQDWPKFPYNGVMAFVYLALSTAWILIWARDHEHTYKIHVVLGAVAVAGAMTYTLDFLELGLKNSGGVGHSFVRRASSFLRILELTLFNIVLMMFSTGYGISRPLLSNRLKVWIFTLGTLFCVILMAYTISVDDDNDIKYSLPILYKVAFSMLVCIKLAIFGWLMGFAIFTLVGLWQRDYSRKLVTFGVFTAACIVSFIVSSAVSFMSVTAAARYCTKNWTTQWIFEATSGIILFLLLILLMWLWRPADPMQSYAFTPLLNNMQMDNDEEDDGEENEKVPLEPL